MTLINIPPRTPGDWDRPAAEVAADAACIVLRQAREASHSPSDQIAFALDERLLAHPDAVATEADYPNWTPGGAS